MIKKTLIIAVALCLVTVSAGCISSGEDSGGITENLMGMALSQAGMSEEDRAMFESLMSGDYASLMQGMDVSAADDFGEYPDYESLMQGMGYPDYYQSMGSDPYSAAYAESGMNADEMNALMSLLSGGTGGYSSPDILTAGSEEDMESMTEEEMAMLESYLSSFGGLF